MSTTAVEDDMRRRLELQPDQKLGHLSHGMQMKVCLAAALPHRPALLVLDEPLSGLDVLVRDEVMGGLLAHSEETYDSTQPGKRAKLDLVTYLILSAAEGHPCEVARPKEGENIRQLVLPMCRSLAPPGRATNITNRDSGVSASWVLHVGDSAFANPGGSE